jgi:hypothetical protein
MSADSVRWMRAKEFVDSLDTYIEAKAAYDKAAARCTKQHGMVIYDLLHVEKDARDKARDALVYVVRDIQE